MIKQIITLTAKYLNLNVEDIISKSREQKYVYARSMIVKLCFDVIQNVTYQEVGNKIGHRDHSTIIQSKKSHDNLYQTHEPYRRNYDELKHYVKSNIKEYITVYPIRLIKPDYTVTIS